MEALTYVWFIVRYTFVVINSDSAEDFQLVLCVEQEHALNLGASQRRLVAILAGLSIKACAHNERGELNFLKLKAVCSTAQHSRDRSSRYRLHTRFSTD